MEIKRYEGTGRMSRAVVYNNTVYLCGQTCNDKDSVGEQTEVVLKKVEDLLNKYGSDKNSILSATIYLKNMDDFAAMNEVWDRWVNDGNEPARACVEARMARDTLLVEISITAAVK